MMEFEFRNHPEKELSENRFQVGVKTILIHHEPPDFQGGHILGQGRPRNFIHGKIKET